MTPHETIRTMTPAMKQALRDFMAGHAGDVDALALRGIIRLDADDMWVLSAHGTQVWKLIRLGV